MYRSRNIFNLTVAHFAVMVVLVFGLMVAPNLEHNGSIDLVCDDLGDRSAEQSIEEDVKLNSAVFAYSLNDAVENAKDVLPPCVNERIAIAQLLAVDVPPPKV